MDTSDNANKKLRDLFFPPLSNKREFRESENEETEIILEPIRSDGYLDYTCLLIPRLPSHQLKGDLAIFLYQSLRQICLSHGWRLEFTAINPDYLEWVLQVNSSITPLDFIHTIRSETSKKILSNFGQIARENLTKDFWAPGHLVVLGMRPHQNEKIAEYIELLRSKQALIVHNEITVNHELTVLIQESEHISVPPPDFPSSASLNKEKYLQLISKSEELLSNLYQSLQNSVEVNPQITTEIERHLLGSMSVLIDDLNIRYINKNKKRKDLFSKFNLEQIKLLEILERIRSSSQYDFANLLASLQKVIVLLNKIYSYENRPKYHHNRLAGDTTTDAPPPAGDVKKRKKRKN